MNPGFKISELFSRVTDLLLLNFLFVITSLPVITAGASLTALYSVSLRMVRNEDSYIIRSFFHSFRRNFAPATKGFLTLSIPSGLMAANIFITLTNPHTLYLPVLILSAFFLCILCCCALYFFPVLARFDFTVKQCFRHVFHMIASHPGKFVFLIIIALPFLFLLFYSPGSAAALGIFFLVTGCSLLSYVQSVIFRQIFEEYEKKA